MVKRASKILKCLAAVIVTVAVIAGLAFLAVDSWTASRAEARLSRDIQEAGNLNSVPKVSVGGQPYLNALNTDVVPEVTVKMQDVDIEGLGPVDALTHLTDIKVAPEQVKKGNLSGAVATFDNRIIIMGAVSFGRLLHMDDLSILNPYDSSRYGSAASEARLVGTPKGFDKKVEAKVKLRLVGPMFHMTVEELKNVPAGREDEARKAFTFDMDTRALPLGGQVSSVTLNGILVLFQAQRVNTTINAKDIAPIDFGRITKESTE